MRKLSLELDEQEIVGRMVEWQKWFEASDFLVCAIPVDLHMFELSYWTALQIAVVDLSTCERKWFGLQYNDIGDSRSRLR